MKQLGKSKELEEREENCKDIHQDRKEGDGKGPRRESGETKTGGGRKRRKLGIK